MKPAHFYVTATVTGKTKYRHPVGITTEGNRVVLFRNLPDETLAAGQDVKAEVYAVNGDGEFFGSYERCVHRNGFGDLREATA